MVDRHVKFSSAVAESPAKNVGPKEPPERPYREIARIGPTSGTEKLPCLDFCITVEHFKLMGEAVEGVMEDHGSACPLTSR